MRAARTDGNHQDIVRALYAAGMKAQSLAAVGQGFPDLCVGFRGLTLLLEVKDSAQPPNKRALTAAERDWHNTWPGHVAIVETPESAIKAVVEHAKKCGVL